MEIDRPNRGPRMECPLRPVPAPTFVPIGSWIYPALERLATLASLKRNSWECVHGRGLSVPGLVRSADDAIADSDADPARSSNFIQELEFEFASELDVLGGGFEPPACVWNQSTRA